MKYLPLLLLLIINFGCMDKKQKPDFEVTSNSIAVDSFLFVGVDTTPIILRNAIIFKDYKMASRDNSGKWIIDGECSYFLEIFYQQNERKLQIIDSLKSEIMIIKANKAQYHYSDLSDWYNGNGIRRIRGLIDTNGAFGLRGFSSFLDISGSCSDSIIYSKAPTFSTGTTQPLTIKTDSILHYKNNQ